MKKISRHPDYEKIEKFSDSFSLSQDIIAGACMITVTGTMRVYVENYKGILEYGAEKIVLQGIRDKITILGKRLTIHYYTNEDMLIHGRIEGVLFNESSEGI